MPRNALVFLPSIRPTMAAATGVCLCLQAALDAGMVDAQRLAAAAQIGGLRVRPAASPAADLLVCKAGSTLAFLQWRGSGGGGADSSVDGGNAARISRMSAAFKSSFVLVPYALLGDAEVLSAAAR